MSDRRERRHDWRQVETVARMLEAIADIERNTVRALIACDAAVHAVEQGLNVAMTPRQIAKAYRRRMAELAKAKGANG